MNIGVLGGTFDPVHNGHLEVADEAHKKLNLAEVIFMPAGQPWMKSDRVIAPARHRLQMLRLALVDKPYCKISTMEIEREGPTYTIDTVHELKKQLRPGDELFFIMGQESLVQLPQWHEASRLISLCRFVVAPRPGCPRPDFKAMEKVLPGIRRQVMLLDRPYADISGTDIRERAARGLSIHHLVPEPVNRYIKEQGLYST
jgi:nicotinate-nucleotide adenylyltransferase